jgi:predicted metal-dependent HD superfamily phosphohydrolase
VTIDVHALRSRFERAVEEAGGTRASQAAFAQLVARYAEAHRHYHTLAHIDACLRWLDLFRRVAEHPHEVELALWFHDVVYLPGRADNERRSAEFARLQLGALAVAAATVTRIARYVEATEQHSATGGDAALVADLDLTILGSPPSDFELFERQIRREYAHVPGPMYRVGRRRVLQRLVSRQVIYQVPQIRQQLETPARANLGRRIGELSRWFSRPPPV